MWAILRINLLGNELLSIETGHQKTPPQVVNDDTDDDPVTGGPSHNFDRRPVEDVRDTAGWLPTGNVRIGFASQSPGPQRLSERSQ